MFTCTQAPTTSESKEWAQLQDDIHLNGLADKVVPISNVIGGYSNDKADFIAGLITHSHDLDNPWNFSFTIQDTSGAIEVCCHNSALTKFAALRIVGCAVLLRNVTVYSPGDGYAAILVIGLENVSAVCRDPPQPTEEGVDGVFCSPEKGVNKHNREKRGREETPEGLRLIHQHEAVGPQRTDSPFVSVLPQSFFRSMANGAESIPGDDAIPAEDDPWSYL